MTRNKILVVEDDTTLQEVLRYNLEEQGYEVISVTEGIKAIELIIRNNPDLIVLDIMLPELDGFKVCQIVRNTMIVPIIVLSAMNQEQDKVKALQYGADDYVTKPFKMRELLARIYTLLRKRTAVGVDADTGNNEQSWKLSFPGLELDLAGREVTVQGISISLKLKEFDLLVLLVENMGKVISREQILQKIWGYDYIGDNRTVDVYISNIRKMIESDPQHPERIVTVYGVGYKFTG